MTLIIVPAFINDSTVQQFNNSTVQQFNSSTIQQFNNFHYLCTPIQIIK